MSMTKIRVPGYRHVFCGYYDRSPFRPGHSNHVLLHANNENSSREPANQSETDLLLWDREKEELVLKIDSTLAWNWQQGSRLFWLDEDRLIYNKYEDGKIGTRIFNLHQSTTEKLEHPVQDATSDCFVSLNYRCLSRFRKDYGYTESLLGEGDDLSPYLFVLDHRTNTERFVRWETFSNAIGGGETIPQGCRLNHACISPDSNFIVFLLRYGSGTNDQSTKHFLMLHDVRNGTTTCLLRDAMVSHYSWKNAREIILWGKLDDVPGYYLVDISSNVQPVTTSLPDGHPNLLRENLYITDTYPNGKQHRELYLCAFDGRIARVLALPERPSLDVSARCDFHPSVSQDGLSIQLDTNVMGKREVWIFNDIERHVSEMEQP
ncbi:hypothetical protein M2324_003886 [Rhodovulum sulfidophilum]|uniref:hypothetical protein n=1 Tax=Rhodovulum sulfidophilum TaxID=35806 RepID=UPI0005A94310|nr:hypothetical protein [Rhodovulum sulfidophilum]ANB34410.1 hypothetical protein A6W98_10190 [Rhodovulum sulfidophilum DSM 1374]ANB38233.1 hypothetical protein A6024_10050 [Rhodovulum sulfidophilum]MCW2305460.1 hypothetical protein [Rhodovulum sulfidophilum]